MSETRLEARDSISVGTRSARCPFQANQLPRLVRGFFSVPSMIDSLEVKVLHPA